MATIIRELNPSRESTEGADNPSEILRYVVYGTSDPVEVDTLVAETLPATKDVSLALPGSTETSPTTTKYFQDFKKTYLGNDVWNIEAHYGKWKPKDDGSWDFQFDTSGGKTRVFQGLSDSEFYTNESSYLLGDPKIPHDGSIGKNAEGVEIDVGSFGFTATLTIKALSAEYIGYLEEKTGSVNSDTVNLNLDGVVLTFQPGELKFDHATGGKSGGDQWKISLKCSVHRNKTGLSFGDIPNVEKKGWQYLWIDYQKNKAAGAEDVTQTPIQVNVETIYPTTTLSEIFSP